MGNKPEKCATRKPLTNGDRIRAMTDKELANFIAAYITCDFCWLRDDCSNYGNVTCYDNFLDWIRSPVEGSEK
nr:MAG TPA: hypothetical protein [Caudoviricetes sp.]